MRVFLVDDEPIALRRLRRLLAGDRRVEIVGDATDSADALDRIRSLAPDVLFLDIQMPAVCGFDLLTRLGPAHPLVVFVTAHEQYALEAFTVNSIDYLLKPVTRAELNRAIGKLERVLGGSERRGDFRALLVQVQAAVRRERPEYLVRVPSRSGDHIDFVSVADVTHFYARDGVTYAATAAKHHVIDVPLADLEPKLDPRHWLRVHRASLVNIEAVKELHGWFGGRALLRLQDGKTQLPVPRERVAAVKARLGL